MSISTIISFWSKNEIYFFYLNTITRYYKRKFRKNKLIKSSSKEGDLIYGPEVHVTHTYTDTCEIIKRSNFYYLKSICRRIDDVY